MTDLSADRLSRIAALRPARPALAPAAVASGSEQLVRLLEQAGTVDHLGGHIRLRCRLPEPAGRTFGPQSLRLIAGSLPDSFCDCRQWLFLDTETTGLAGGSGTYAFLVGLAWWEEDGFVVEQHFMRDHGEERSLLLGIAQQLAGRAVLVSFNGKSFDWPLLQTRFQMTRIGRLPEPAAHLDLLYPARRLWRLSLPSVALTQLERHVLNLDRGKDIPSETIPQRYFDFLRGGAAEAVAEIFLHNRLDLAGLAALALHIDCILADPDTNRCCAGELFGISRMLQQRGDGARAARLYRKALDQGLPRPVEQSAQRELAFLARRERDYEAANAMWEQLLDGSAAGMLAYEQLAIYYEHRADLLERAAELSREALLKLQEAFQSGRIPASAYRQWHGKFNHRLKRIRNKLTVQD